MVPLFSGCHFFQENPILLFQPNWDVQSRLLLDLFRKFVGAIGGTDDSARDLELLSDGSKLIGLSMEVADWRTAYLSFSAGAQLITTSLDEQLQSSDQAIRLVGARVDRLLQGTMEGEQERAVKAINLAAEQRRTLARKMWALECEIGGLWETVAASLVILKEGLVSIERQANDGQEQATADVRTGAQLEAVVDKDGRNILEANEMQRMNEQLEQNHHALFEAKMYVHRFSERSACQTISLGSLQLSVYGVDQG
jgi:hypothetical protein